MKGIMRFAKIIILIGCLVFLGLNTAAQGLQKMAPDISHGFLEISSYNQVWTVTALGKEFQWNGQSTIALLSNLKNKVDQSANLCKQSVVLWEGIIMEKGESYLPYWKEKYRELLFSKEKENYSY